jgi:capsular polysaccharide transport system permease protein
MDGLNLPLDRADAAGSRLDRGRISRQRPHPPRFKKWLPLLLFVGLPTCLATGYYTAIASYEYTSEARFVVRTPNQPQPSVVSSLLEGASGSESDTFSVHDYVLSRGALQELVQNDNLRELFARPEADFLSRFPNFFTTPNFEHLYRYYLNHVDVDYNSTTGLSTLIVDMFRPEDAKLIASSLIEASERLVNRLNERARVNALKDSLKQVDDAQNKARAIAAQIAAFRNREVMLDPTKQSSSILQGVTDLQAKLTQTRTQITELSQSSPNSPLLAAERRHASALEGQIDDALKRVAGSDHSMVPKITAYDDLSLQRDFAERELASATTSLERARVDAQRQQLYLDLIVQPNSPDYPAYPKRIRSIAVVFASCLVLYTLARLLIAAAREHSAR